jgi:hypothetical protein
MNANQSAPCKCAFEFRKPWAGTHGRGIRSNTALFRFRNKIELSSPYRLFFYIFSAICAVRLLGRGAVLLSRHLLPPMTVGCRSERSAQRPFYVCSIGRKTVAQRSWLCVHSVHFATSFLLAVLLGVLALTTLPALGQGSLPDGQVLNGETAKPVPGGHDYIHLAAETVSPSNGSVSIKFNYPMPKGRRITIPFAPEFNTAGLYHVALNLTTQLGTVTMVPNVTNFGIYPTATWSMSSFTPPPVTCPPACPAPNPWGVCHTASGFNFTDQYGTSHNLGLAVVANAQNYTSNNYCPPAGSGSAGVAIPSSSQSPPPGNGDGQVWAIWTSPSQTVTDVENFQGGVVGLSPSRIKKGRRTSSAAVGRTTRFAVYIRRRLTKSRTEMAT